MNHSWVPKPDGSGMVRTENPSPIDPALTQKQRLWLFGRALKDESGLLMGIIGRHLHITSERGIHQARLERGFISGITTLAFLDRTNAILNRFVALTTSAEPSF